MKKNRKSSKILFCLLSLVVGISSVVPLSSFAGKVADISAEDIVRAEREKRMQALGKVPFTGFFLIAASGTKEELEKAIKAGADVNAGDPEHGETPPLTLAAGNNTDPEVVRLLLEAGADVNHVGKNYRRTPLHQAVLFNKNALPIIKELLKKNPNLYVVDTEGRVPLEYAIMGTIRNNYFDGVPRDDIILALLNASVNAPYTLEGKTRTRFFTGQFNLYKAALKRSETPNQEVVEAFKKAGAEEK